MSKRVLRWLDERLDLRGLERSLLKREVPDRLTWWHTLGSATLTVFLVQVATGSVLAVYYAASPDHAYDSIQYIETQVISGHVLRGIHHWAASAMVLLVFAHMMRVFMSGAYKYPREVNWLLGVGLLSIVLGFGFTGYLLPWDQKAYWATQVGTSIAGTVPVLGSAIVSILRGGAQLGAATLTRFYALHVLWLPMFLGGLILLHIALVIRQGIAPRPSALETDAPATTNAHGYRAYYKAAYAKTKLRGVRFWPDIIGKDAIVSLAVIAVLVALGVFAGAGLDAPADPTDTSYVPLPEWYFLPFYQLLKLVPGSMESVVAVGVPAALILVLLLLPLFDRRSTRSLSHRPVAIGSLAFVLVSCALLLGAALRGRVTNEPAGNAAQLTLAARTGRALFKQQQCGACHTVTPNGDGGAIGPDLSQVGLRRSSGWMHSFIESPVTFHPNSGMPSFGPPTLSHSEIEEIAQYLSSLRGTVGHPGIPDVHDTFPPIPGATNKQEASR